MTASKPASSIAQAQDAASAQPNRQAVASVNSTGNDLIDGVLSGATWSGGSLTYSFPDSKNDYYSSYSDDNEPDNDFSAVGSGVQAAAKFILDKSYGTTSNDGFSVEGFTTLNIFEGSDTGATIRYAESSAPDTAWGYYPDTSSSGGDVWFGTNNYDFNKAKLGNYYWATVIHETGHALGLKHGHQSENGFPALPAQYDSLEYSVMTYNSFVGDDGQFYKNETYGYPQTFMMADIAALQEMYGANFDVNNGRTVYSWKPGVGDTYVNGKVALDTVANRIFATIWDGGGSHDVYDLRAYKTSVKIDLRPGETSVFSKTQLADLGAYNGEGEEMASGNIYNALQYKNYSRSLIEDAVGGSGNDALSGNKAENLLHGMNGNDKLRGYEGNDRLLGDGGNDIFYFRRGWDRDRINDFGDNDKVDLSSTFNISSFKSLMSKATNSGDDVVFNFGSGDTLTVVDVHKSDLNSGDFIL